MSHAIRFLNPLGAEELRFHSLLLTERMGDVSEGRLVALSRDRNVPVDALLGQKVSVEIETQFWGKRFHNAYVTRCEVGARHESDTMYHLELRPWLWFLSRTADCRVFQNQSIVEILQTVFADCPVSVVANRLTQVYPARPYVVQYRESDLNFVLRLMEREGIYCFFEHTEDNHTLVLADGPSAHPKLAGGYATIPYSDGANALGMSVDKESLSIWRSGKRIQSGKYVLNDFDFKRPSADIRAFAEQVKGHPHAAYELYDYPGEYRDQFAIGDSYVRVRLDEWACQHERMFAAGPVRGCTPGGVFSLAHHPRSAENRDYLILSTTTRLEEASYESSGGQYHASVEMEVQPAATPYRPARVTAKPFVQGPQTAVVVGPPGEEIWCDEYGRVKVQFHWDRYGKKDDQSSCWVRVSHPWAGAGFGGMHVPRIGQEVVVSFLEGDPDYPMITGRVYNAENNPPWALPANKTQSGFLTRSSQGGSAANANALRFEDKKGEEEVWLHAEKDQRIEVEHDESHWVGNDRKKTIDRDETTLVHRHRTETVDGNETITIHQNRTEIVDQNETITIHQNRTETVDQNETITIHQNRTETVDQNEQITVHQNRSRTVDLNEQVSIGKSRTKTIGNNETDKIAKNWSLKTGKMKTETIGVANLENIGMARMTNIGMAYSLNVGMIMNTVVGVQQSEQIGKQKSTKVGEEYSIDVGEDFTLKAGKTIKLAVGNSILVMKSDGSIALTGKEINITAQGGNVTVNGTKIFLNPIGGSAAAQPEGAGDKGAGEEKKDASDATPGQQAPGAGGGQAAASGGSDLMNTLNKAKGAFGTLNQLTQLAASTGLGGGQLGKAAGMMSMASGLMGGGSSGAAGKAGMSSSGDSGSVAMSEAGGMGSGTKARPTAG